MSRYSKRSATNGTVVLNSCKERGNTQQFWFYRKEGKKWLEFDVREVAKLAGAELPCRMTSEEISNCSGSEQFEAYLCRDLQHAADWLARVDLDGEFTKQVAL